MATLSPNYATIFDSMSTLKWDDQTKLLSSCGIVRRASNAETNSFPVVERTNAEEYTLAKRLGTVNGRANQPLQVPINQNNTIKRDATVKDIIDTTEANWFDIRKINYNIIDDLTTDVIEAARRRVNNIFFAQLFLNRGTPVGSTTANVSKNSLLALHEALNAANAPANDRYLLVNPRGFTHLMLLDEFVSVDYISQRQNTPWDSGTRGRILGFDIIVYNDVVDAFQKELNAGTAAQPGSPSFSNDDPEVNLMYAWQKRAMGSYYASDITVEMEWNMDLVTNLIQSRVQYGAVAILPEGVASLQYRQATS